MTTHTNKHIFCLFLLTMLIACDNSEIKPQVEPATFEYGSIILTLDLPTQLIAKSDTNVHAKFVFDKWFEIDSAVLPQNELMEDVLYEIEISSVLDTTNVFGPDWLPVYATSRSSDGFIWNKSGYHAKFYQSHERWGRGLVEVGIDDSSQYILWYTSYEIHVVEQSRDGNSGSVTNSILKEGEFSVEYANSWQFSSNRLRLDYTEKEIAWSILLYPSGAREITYPLECSDRYFWSEEGNGVLEDREVHSGNCYAQFTIW